MDEENNIHEGEGGAETGGAVASDLPTNRVYLGNLSWQVKQADLEEFCGKSGIVVKADILLGHDGRSKGCAIVEFESAEDAERAITELHDVELMGRKVFIREDREAEKKYITGTPRSSNEAGNQLFVGNLPYTMSWQDLKDLFRPHGEIVRADVLKNEDLRSKGCGIVVYTNAEDAQRAIAEMDRREVDGRALEVRLDKHVGSVYSNPYPQPPRYPVRREDEYRREIRYDDYGYNQAPPPRRYDPYSGGGGGGNGYGGGYPSNGGGYPSNGGGSYGYGGGGGVYDRGLDRNRMVGGECFKCGRPGHKAFDCRERPSGGGEYRGGPPAAGGAGCYKCGREGHFARECTDRGGDFGGSRGGGSSSDCFKCGKPGHFARECPVGGAGGGRSADCYKCGKPGHIARDCTGSGDAGGSARKYDDRRSRSRSPAARSRSPSARVARDDDDINLYD